jgi:hypothetical protein
MPHVTFVAPRFLETTNRYVASFAAIDDVTLSVISEDPAEAIPAPLRARIAGHYQVRSSLDAGALTAACDYLRRSIGPIDRLAGALEQLQVPMARTRDALDIEGMRNDVAQAFRDKDRMKAVLRAHGVPVARSALTESPADLEAFIGQVGFPIIMKPQAGLGARETYRITSREDLVALSARGVVPDGSRPLQVEEFVKAREHTCETVTVRGVPVWRSGTRYLPTPLEVLENPWIQYCVLLPREDEDSEWTRFEATNTAALAALFGGAASTAAGTALTHMEWFLRDDGTSLVNEVGARPPGVGIMPLMSIAHETDFFRAWALLMAKDSFTPKPRKWAAGAAFLRGHGGGQHVAAVTGVEEAVAAVGHSLVELRSPRVGQPRATGYEGEGFAYVRHATTDGAKEALLTLIKTIQVRYA